MTTTDLVPIASPADVLAYIEPAAALVERMATTSFVPKEYRGKPNELLAAILTGVEMGVPPMAAMAKFHNIEGRAAPAAELMRSVVLRQGHDIWIEHASDVKVTVGGRRANSTRDNFVTWTIDKARAAGLAGKQNWRKYPQAMLLARATAELCRMVFADCLSGMSYSQEELEDGIDDLEADAPAAVGDRPAGASKPKSPTRARRAPKPKPDTAPSPAVDPLDEIAELDAMADGGTAPVVEDDIVEAELVDDEPPSDVATLPPDRALAARAREVGLTDHQRHGLYWAISESRTGTGKELGTDEITRAFELMDADGLRVVEDSPGDWTVFVGDELVAYGTDPGAGAADGVPGDADGWRALLKEHGRKVGEVIQFAQGLAKDLGADPPTSVPALAGCPDELARRVAVFVRTGE